MNKVIIYFLIISSFALADGWNNYLTTTLNVSGAQNVKLFSNSFGNNVIVHSSLGALSYYLINSDGSVGPEIPIESSGVTIPCITGNAYSTYIVYKKDNSIKVKFTTNSGANWSIYRDLNLVPNTLDATYTDRLHISFTYNGHAWYYQYLDGWTNSQDVSNNETGSNPRIQSLYHGSVHEVYVVYNTYDYNTNTNYSKSRKLDLSTGNWESNSHILYSNNNSFAPIGFGVDDSYIYNYFYILESGIYNSYQYTIRKSDYTLSSMQYRMSNQIPYVHSTNSADNKVHVAYNWIPCACQDLSGYRSISDGLQHENFNNGSSSIETIYNYSGGISCVDISSTKNDLFVIFKTSDSNYLKYKQYNATPSAPQGLNLSNVSGHPNLTWTKNPEADILKYYIYKTIGLSETKIGESSSNTYYDGLTNICTAVYPQVCPDETTAKYRVSTIDKGLLESAKSDYVSTRIIGNPPDKVKGDIRQIKNYVLMQNYPNPFNPSTVIKYQLPEGGLVSLKVYDLLGREVAQLVNELQDQGSYKVIFNSQKLSGGVYIYSLRVNDFVQNQKMTYLK